MNNTVHSDAGTVFHIVIYMLTGTGDWWINTGTKTVTKKTVFKADKLYNPAPN